MAKFVDNEKFYNEMVSWKQALYKNRENGSDERPDIPEYIGECIWKIASRYATKPNWRNSYNEDMVGDAVEECIKYLDRFDETKSKNPFSYFTQIVYYSFLRKISTEKKLLYIKYKKYSIHLSFGREGQGKLRNPQFINIHKKTLTQYLNKITSIR